jgi:spore maturation protein CgeB
MRAMHTPRLQVGTSLRAAMCYERFAGATPRLLVLESQYWIDQACLRASARLGWDVARVPVPLAGTMPKAMIASLLETLTNFRPDFAVTVNLGGMDEAGILAELLDTFGVPLVTWFVDDPRTIMLDRACYAAPSGIALTWEPAYADYLRRHGYARVETLPLAADRALFDAPPADAPGLPPTFVGNSMAGFAASEWAWIAERPALAACVRQALDAGRVSREGFAAGIDALLGPAAAGFDAHERRHAEMYCFIEATRRTRGALLGGLADAGVVARGDPDWASVTPHHAPYVDYATELPGLYRDSVAHVNTTSMQMATAVNQRVFDCPAAGGLVITDAQAQLATLFNPDEMAVYHSVEECAALVARFRADAAGRAALIARARRRVLEAHTYEHRLERIAGWVRASLQS